MIDSITRITLNLQETNTMVSIRAKRGDTGRKLLIHLSDGSIPYHISDDCYATFTAKKPDGTKINNACTIENNVIEYEFTDQTCTAVGTMKAEIRLYGADDKMITSACFLVNVYDTVFRDGDEVDSEGEMNILDDLILRANAFLNETGKLLRWQGNWDSETEYEANDLVLHEEVLYVAEEAIAAGTAPGSEEVTAWVPIAGMGTGSGADLTAQVDRAEAAAKNAESAAAEAEAARDEAKNYSQQALNASSTAAGAANSAYTSANNANLAANRATSFSGQAGGYADKAAASATAAEAAATRAEEAAANAGTGSGGNADQSGGLTTAQIEALHGMFEVCAYDESKDVSGAYAAFKTAFGITDDSSGDEEPDEPVTPEKTLTSISATYSGGDVPVGTAVTALTGIVVKATYSDGSTATVTGYTLFGTIAEGSNTVTVSYGGKTTTFTVTGVAESGGDDSGETPEILYELAEPTVFDGTKSIDTGWNPFNEDKDFTVVCKAETLVDGYSSTNSDTTIFSAYQYINGIYDLSAVCKTAGKVEVCGAAGESLSTDNRMVITHKKGESVMNATLRYIRQGTSDNTATGQTTYTVNTKYTTTLTLAYSNRYKNYFIGTINDFKIYSRVLTAAEIEAYLA